MSQAARSADRASPGPMSTVVVILHRSRDTLPTEVNVKCSVTKKRSSQTVTGSFVMHALTVSLLLIY